VDFAPSKTSTAGSPIPEAGRQALGGNRPGCAFETSKHFPLSRSNARSPAERLLYRVPLEFTSKLLILDDLNSSGEWTGPPNLQKGELRTEDRRGTEMRYSKLRSSVPRQSSVRKNPKILGDGGEGGSAALPPLRIFWDNGGMTARSIFDFRKFARRWRTESHSADSPDSVIFFRSSSPLRPVATAKGASPIPSILLILSI
jgi:hypothetical protein